MNKRLGNLLMKGKQRMSKTRSLKKLIKSDLKKVCENVTYNLANTPEMFPHIVFGLIATTMVDFNRDTYMVIIDVWDDDNSTEELDNMVDNIQSMFNNFNQPDSDILPTFFIEGIRDISDTNKTIKRKQLTIECQLYEKE